MTWSWAAASRRGSSHVKAGTRCQDANRCLVAGDSGSLVAVACDGAGSALFGGQGASIVCRTIASGAAEHLSRTSSAPLDDDVWSWIDEARDRIALAAGRRELLPRQFATTLVATIVCETETVLIHVGDGAAVVKSDGIWKSPSWPENGEYASTTYFVTDDPLPRLRVTRLGKVDRVAVFTDGVERLALNFSNMQPHAPFFEGIFSPLENAQAQGKSSALSKMLSDYLDSAAINERTDDDKTLILAIRK